MVLASCLHSSDVPGGRVSEDCKKVVRFLSDQVAAWSFFFFRFGGVYDGDRGFDLCVLFFLGFMSLLEG